MAAPAEALALQRAVDSVAEGMPSRAEGLNAALAGAPQGKRRRTKKGSAAAAAAPAPPATGEEEEEEEEAADGETSSGGEELDEDSEGDCVLVSTKGLGRAATGPRRFTAPARKQQTLAFTPAAAAAAAAAADGAAVPPGGEPSHFNALPVADGTRLQKFMGEWLGADATKTSGKEAQCVYEFGAAMCTKASVADRGETLFACPGCRHYFHHSCAILIGECEVSSYCGKCEESKRKMAGNEN